MQRTRESASFKVSSGHQQGQGRGKEIKLPYEAGWVANLSAAQ